MAEQVGFPITARIESLSLGLEYPGQEVLFSPFTGTQQIINRNSGFWMGTISVVEVLSFKHDNDNYSNAMELFLAQLRGQENYFEIDLSREKFGSFQMIDRAGVFEEVAETNKPREIVFDFDSNPSSYKAAVLGKYITFKHRLHQIVDTKAFADNRFDEALICAPHLPPIKEGDQSEFSVDPIIRCVLSDTRNMMTSKTGNFAGPWTLTFREYIDVEDA